jgi:hypothetical protein
MEVLPCGHAAVIGHARMCVHLVGDKPQTIAHKRVLRGEGLAADLCCPACADLDEAVRELVVACEGCVARIIEDEWEFVGWVGSPGIRERRVALPSVVTEFQLPDRARSMVDVQPVYGHQGSVWLGLTRDGSLLRLDLDSGSVDTVGVFGDAMQAEVWTFPVSIDAGTGSPVVVAEEDKRRWEARMSALSLEKALHVSRTGRFAAIVSARGSTGVVVDLDRGEVSLSVDRGTYRVEHTDFPFAFAHLDGRDVVVHGSAWNKLDVSLADSGELLTARQPSPSGEGQPRPEQYLDYFHGTLNVSPTEQWIADDGWVWHPIGVPRSWNLQRWTTQNPWESEDGPSVRRLCMRNYHWGHPMCWVGDDELAISGIGFDDEHMLPGVRVFNARSGQEINTFAGPDGQLFFDGHLYASSANGLEVWDVHTAERLGSVSGFVPSRHHRGAHELITPLPESILRWRLPQAEDAVVLAH